MPIGSHHSAASKSDVWLTPPYIMQALGAFDLDPCAAIDQPWATATRHYTVEDNGLTKKWEGRVWLNPPYANGVIDKWMRRMVEHNHGMALLFARTETENFHATVWQRATAVHFFEGRLFFHRIDGLRAANNAGAPSALCSYGPADARILADCGLPGVYIRLR